MMKTIRKKRKMATAINLKDKAILKFLTDTVWAMEFNILTRMTDIVTRHADNIKLSSEDIKAAIGEDDDDGRVAYRESGNTAIIPITGVIAKHTSQVNGISQAQGTSCEEISANIDRALNNPKIQRLILHVESPGGSVGGVADLAAKIATTNKQKPVIAYVDDMADSAAWWLASQADKVYASRNAEVGSIGVYTVLRDSSVLNEQMGVKYKIVKSGQYKGVGTPQLGLKEEELADIQNRINSIHRLFVADVAKGRGLDVAALSQIADGRVFSPDEAIKAGLIDGISTLQDVIDDKKSAVASGNELGQATAVKNDSELFGDTKMADENKKTFTADELAKSTSDAVAAAVAAEQKRVQAVTKVLAGHTDLLQTALADASCDETKATAMLVPALQKAITEKDAKLAEAQTKLDAIAKGGNTPVQTNASDNIPKPDEKKTEAKGDDGKSETYVARVKAIMAADKNIKKGDAMTQAGKELPEAHKAWIAAGQPD
jgi:signal peptide peptidase SppA